MRRFDKTLVIALSLLFLVSINSAQQISTTAVPNLIRYSGTLKDAQGAAISSSTVGVTFTLYKQQDGGAAVWLETQNVTPDSNGQYNVVLGSTIARGLPTDLFSQQEERWLGVQVQGQAEQARVLLVSVPYAFKAHEAETLGGLPASAFVKAPTSEASTGTSTDAASQNIGTVAAPGRTTSGKTKSPLPLSQTPNYITVFDAGLNLVNSLMSQGGTTVGVAGSLNLNDATQAYFISGSRVLSINGSNNLFAGPGAGTKNTGASNTFLGASAGFNTSGSGNSFFGAFAGNSNTTGFNNTFSGFNAGIGNTVGYQNAFYGFSAGYHNSSGFNNTFLGQNAGTLNTTGGSNTFTGAGAGYNNSIGNYNVFSGTQAGASNTSGSENSFFGYLSGYTSTGSQNSFFGSNAGRNNLTGGSNVFDGAYAGYSNSTGAKNVVLGVSAGYNNTAGSNNVFLGYQAGKHNITGNYNVYIANPGDTESNTIRIGDPVSNTATYIAGIYGAATNGGSAVFIDSTGKLGTTGTLPVGLLPEIKAQQQQIEKLQQRLSQLEAVISRLTQAGAQK